MKISNTSERLTTIMSEYNLRQVDILNAAKPFCEQYEIKLGKNDLSQYVNGKVEPGPEKLTVLALALNVSETWLMGYDVPKRPGLTIGKKVNQCIAHNIQHHRESAKLSQKQFAEILGVDEAFFAGLESGQNSLEKEMLYKICDALNLIPGNIIPRDDDEFTEDEEYLLSRREKNAPGELILTEDEIRILTAFRSMSPERQKALADLLGISDSQK